MMIARPASVQSATSETPLASRHRLRITALAVIASLACSGTTSCTKTQIGLSIGGIAAGLVLITVGTTIAIKDHNDHTVRGCIYSDAEGFKLRTSDAKIYTLEGDPGTLRAGDRVRLHGSKAKRAKANESGQSVFVVESLSKDYGPCPANLAMSASPAH
jgi:hypothetical protein